MAYHYSGVAFSVVLSLCLVRHSAGSTMLCWSVIAIVGRGVGAEERENEKKKE